MLIDKFNFAIFNEGKIEVRSVQHFKCNKSCNRKFDQSQFFLHTSFFN